MPKLIADRLGVADVQVRVRLWREAGDDAVVAAVFEVDVDGFANEVAVFVRVHGSSVAGCGVANKIIVRQMVLTAR